MIDKDKREAILRCLVEGNSIRGSARIVGCSKNTVMSALLQTGDACKRYHDDIVRNLKYPACEYMQIDEVWSRANSSITETKQIWVWAGICRDTKLVPIWSVGNRSTAHAYYILNDLKDRVGDRRIQICTDGNYAYKEAVERAFGSDVDYAIVVKKYEPEVRKKRFKACIGVETEVIMGSPDEISTSHIERQNLTMRTNIRRMTRKTNGFSKKLENHAHAVSLHFFYMNFVRIHSSIDITPAMAAGVETRIWDIKDLVDLSVYY